jgi:hypothetical protein
MSFNGSGVYVLPVTTFSPAVGNTTIDSAAQNTLTADIAAALTTCLTKDGQTTVTANLPMATFRHTGVGSASALQTYTSADDVIDNTLLYAGASAVGTDAYAVTLPISPGAYKTGQTYSFLADVANVGACTADFNSIGAKAIKLANGNDPYDNAILADSFPVVQYDGTNLILLNPDKGTSTAAELNRSDITTEGTVEASKVVTADSDGNITYGKDTSISGAAASSISIGSLTFTAGRAIEIEVDLIGITGLSVLHLVINGDTTATNYYSKVGGSASTNTPIVGSIDSGIDSFIKITISPNVTRGECSFVVQTSGFSGSAITNDLASGIYTITDAITSIGIRDSLGNSFLDVGSTLKIIQL